MKIIAGTEVNSFGIACYRYLVYQATFVAGKNYPRK
jgi:hypothetical protein